MKGSIVNQEKSESALININKLLENEAFRINQSIDHIKCLTLSAAEGTPNDQFRLRQGWIALIYRDLRLKDKMFFSRLASITGYSTQMWRKLMKAEYNVRDKSDSKLYHVSDKFIQIVTSSLLKIGYVVETEKMISYHKKTGALVRMFWEEGKCTEVMLQNKAEGPDVKSSVRLVINLKEYHLSRLKNSKSDWKNWEVLDLQRWVLWSAENKILPEMQSKFNYLDESITVSVSDSKHITLSVNNLPKVVTKLELTISRDKTGNLVVSSSTK